MTLATTDIALRAATIALLLLLAASFIRDFGNSLAGRLATAFALGSAAHAATSAIGAASPISAWHAPLIALSTGNVVVFWLFTRALFDDAFVLRWRHALVWLAVAAFSFVNCLWIAPSGNARLAIVAVNLLALGFIMLAVGQMIASWSADLVESRRRLRVFIVTAAALYGGMNAVLQIAEIGKRRGGSRQCVECGCAAAGRRCDLHGDDASDGAGLVSCRSCCSEASGGRVERRSEADRRVDAAGHR